MKTEVEITEPHLLRIAESLRGERIFVTGATGFVGKVLIEKLLWSVPEVGKLLLLIRPGREQNAEQRLRTEIRDSYVMCRLRARHGDEWSQWAASKLEAVSGDLAKDRFGLAEEQYAALIQSVDRVVASAATVTFDERLDRALELNTRGALRTLTLARDAGNVPLVHVSTCFVSGRRNVLSVPDQSLEASVPERIASWGLEEVGDLDTTLAVLEETCRRSGSESESDSVQVEAGKQLSRRYGFNDVYTLSKALAERLIERERGTVPVAIVRPAIIESAASEPVPGWIEAVRVTDPLLVAYGRGRTRDLPGSAETSLELVPVDYVVNALIAALADLGSADPGDAERSDGDAAEHPREIRVYQLASSQNPITLGRLLTYAHEGFSTTPLRDERDQPIRVDTARFIEPDRYRRTLVARRHRIRLLRRGLGSTRLHARLNATERTIDHFLRLLEVYRPYLDGGPRYENAAIRRLWSRLSAAEKEEFPFDVMAIDWRAYVVDVHIPGLVRFALRSETGAPPISRRHDPLAQLHARGEFPATRASNLFELFEIAADGDPSTLAFQTCRRGRWLRYSYGQALTAAQNIAWALENRYGIGRGDRVVLWGAGSPEWVLTSFAAHRLGAVTVPLDPQWPPGEIDQSAQHTQAKLICAAPQLATKLREARGSSPGCPVVELAAPFVPEPDVQLLHKTKPIREAPGAGVQPDDLASIIFTSGTTVAPKAVPLTHGNLLANVRDLVPLMRSSRERMLSVLPIHHVFEFTVGLLVPLVGGGTISYVSEMKPAEISWMMNTTRPTSLVAVPRLLGILHNGIRLSVAQGGPALGFLFRILRALSSITGGRHGHLLFGKVHRRFGGCLRRIATGGSALEPSLGESFRLMGFQVAEGYGLTETSPVLAVNPWDKIRFGSVGAPLPGVEVELRPLAGEAEGSGEIWVRGANVMSGYYNNPEATEQVMKGGWLSTGDIGSFDDDGYLRISGRTKDVIVTAAGKNVYPEEVELRYRELPHVEELVVLGLPSRDGGESVSAVIVPRASATEEVVEQIHAAIDERSLSVPSYQQISRVEIWSGDLPKTTTLKVKRGLLRDAVIAGERGSSLGAAVHTTPNQAEQAESTPTASEMWVESTLARLIRVRSDLIRPSTRLAELGVDSLTKVELVAEVEARLDLRLDDHTAAAIVRVQDLIDLLDTDIAVEGQSSPAESAEARPASRA